MTEKIEEMIKNNYRILDVRVYRLELLYRIEIYITASIIIKFEIQLDRMYTDEYNMMVIRKRINNLILSTFMKG